MDINLIGPANTLGYGIATLNILEQLMEMGNNVAFFPICDDPSQVPDDKRAVVGKAKAFANFYEGMAPSLKIWHPNALAEHVGYGRRAAFTFFELRQFKANELHHLDQLHHLLVASRWAADICKENGFEYPDVVPLGVDRSIFHENITVDRRETDYTIFANVGKWEVRKGHDVLLEAFNKAFEPTDKVILKLVALNPFIGAGNERWARAYLGSKMARCIHIEPDRLPTQRHIARFLRSADCAVFPARGEAWNLELLEAMSCGLACIATDYSGHTEYANEDNCRLIDITEYEDAHDGVWFHGEGQWASFGKEQVDMLVDHMREVHRRKQTGALSPNGAGIETAKRFNWRATAQKILGVLS